MQPEHTPLLKPIPSMAKFLLAPLLLVPVLMSANGYGQVQAAGGRIVIERNKWTIVVEPCGSNIVRVTSSLDKAAAQLEDLSSRERQILELLVQGFANKEIAEHIGLSETTVRWHLRNVYRKLHVRSRTEAAFKFRSSQTP